MRASHTMTSCRRLIRFIAVSIGGCICVPRDISVPIPAVVESARLPSDSDAAARTRPVTRTTTATFARASARTLRAGGRCFRAGARLRAKPCLVRLPDRGATGRSRAGSLLDTARVGQIRSTAAMPWILHASDPHLGVVSPGQELDDSKLEIAREDIETTQTVFRHTLESLTSYVAANGKPSAVVVSGDLTYKGTPEGFTAFAELLGERADVLPDDRARIVVVPGNHDVDWNKLAGTRDRYAGFLGATRDQGCATPLLDGVDFKNSGPLALESGVADVPHVVDDLEYLILPLNSSNYCGTVPPVRVEGAWSATEWKKRLAPLGAASTEALKQLEVLLKHDVARVSRRQVRALSLLFEELKIPVSRGDDPRPRIAVLHHQLLPVSAREEWKTFESLVNLGFVRQALREFGVDVVLHGHKHEENLYWDFARRGSDPVTRPLRRVLIVASPGHFRANGPVLRAIELEATPRARNIRITTFNGVEAYAAEPQIGPRGCPAGLARSNGERVKRAGHGSRPHSPRDLCSLARPL